MKQLGNLPPSSSQLLQLRALTPSPTLVVHSPHSMQLLFSTEVSLPGHVGVVSYAGVAEHVGGPLGHQDLDLVHGAAELQVAQVESRGEPVGAAPLVRQNVLKGRNRNWLNSGLPVR